MFFHGGGMVIGGLERGSDVASRHLCLGADCVVVSVDYRLAPENKFPAAAEDSYAATAWMAKNGASINADGTRLAVTGVSAGGNLSATVALMARDRGGPPLALQVPVVPMIDLDYNTESYREKGKGDYYFTTEILKWCWNHYLRDESDAKNPYAAPLQAKDFRGVAPALVITAEYDRGYVNRCVNDIRRRPSQPLIQWRFHPHTVHRDRRLRSTQGPSDA